MVIFLDSFRKAGLPDQVKNMGLVGLRPGLLLKTAIRRTREVFFAPRDECAECGQLNLVKNLGYCGECDDLCCPDCLLTCDCIEQNCCDGVCFFFHRLCKCPDEFCGEHWCGQYCPDCLSAPKHHASNCGYCEECDAQIPEDCPHDWHEQV